MERSNIPPKTIFYMKISDGNIDGTLDLDGETPEAYESLDEAVESGKKQADKRMGESWIYECRPVRRIRYGKTVVNTVTIG